MNVEIVVVIMASYSFLAGILHKYASAIPENLAKLVADAESVSSKLDRLAGEPFNTGLSHLQLSTKYPTGSKSQLEELMKARDNFNRAASVSNDAQKASSFYFAGRCSEALSDDVGKSFFYQHAVTAVNLHKKKEVETTLDIVGTVINPLWLMDIWRIPFQIRNVVRLRKMSRNVENFWSDDMITELCKHNHEV